MEEVLNWNRAATSADPFPGVEEAMIEGLHALPASRGATGQTTAERIFSIRERAARMFGFPHPERVVFTSGATHALAFRSGYGDPGGLLWAGRWLRLATTEPLTDLPPGPERAAGIDTVTTRFDAKLSDGQPPLSFPTELPLAPAIAPGLVWASPESAMIWDNLSMLLEVLADILASPETVDPPRAIERTLDFFVNPDVAVTDRDDWEIMALRHGIFFQGGFPLAVMTKSERNVDGHAAHLAGGRLMAIPGMPRR